MSRSELAMRATHIVESLEQAASGHQKYFGKVSASRSLSGTR
jgi:hypothetical protein